MNIQKCNTCQKLIYRVENKLRIDYWEDEETLIEIYFCNEECIKDGTTVIEGDVK